MPAAGEHVHGLDALNGKAAGHKKLHIPGQGGGVAGDIDHAPGTGGKDGVNDLGVAALAGRIHCETVDGFALRHQHGQGILRRCAEEGGVLDAVPGDILPGVLHRLGDHLDADDLPGLPG